MKQRHDQQKRQKRLYKAFKLYSVNTIYFVPKSSTSNESQEISMHRPSHISGNATLS